MSWQLTSFLILGGALALGFAWYERSRPPARVLALVAALAALAVVGRLAFAPFPNVKPTTDIVLFAGYALGGAPGFAVGAVTALVSNIFLSHGPWTPWQMAAWGGVGIGGGALGALVRRVRPRRAEGDTTGATEPRELGRWSLALACGVAGLGFGIVMDVYLWTSVADQTAASYLAIAARSLPFNVAHIAGNVGFCLLIGPPLVRALRRYRRRFEVRWAPGGAARRVAPSSAVVVVACVGMVGLAASTASAAPPSQRAAAYVAGSQNGDGGFGSSRGRASAHSYTAEAAFGLAAAGRNPQDVAAGRRSVIDYVKRGAGSLTSTTELERTILLARAAGLSPRRFAGRDLYRELLRRRDSDGSFDQGVAFTAFGVLALRAAGERASSSRVQDAAGWLADRQNGDGGFSLARAGQSDSDLTGAALQALAAAGDSTSSATSRAVTYLREVQSSSGGFGQTHSASANAQSTAYAVQGLVAAGAGDGQAAAAALAYLRSLQSSDGSIRFSRTSGQTPVWVTGQALLALNKQPFPLEPVRRTPQPPRPATPAGGTDDAGQDKAGRGRAEDTVKPRRSSGGRPKRTRPRSGTAGAGDGSRGTGPGAAGAPSIAGTGGGSSSTPRLSFNGAATRAGLPPGLTLPNAAAGALAAPPIPLPGAPPTPLGSPGRLFSDASGVPLNPLASKAPPSRSQGSPGPRIGAGLLLILLVAGAIALATGGGARARRLWAAARRRT